jgi:hypothetical protein
VILLVLQTKQNKEGRKSRKKPVLSSIAIAQATFLPLKLKRSRPCLPHETIFQDDSNAPIEEGKLFLQKPRKQM